MKLRGLLKLSQAQRAARR